jgi:hypothetical protein
MSRVEGPLRLAGQWPRHVHRLTSMSRVEAEDPAASVEAEASTAAAEAPAATVEAEAQAAAVEAPVAPTASPAAAEAEAPTPAEGRLSLCEACAQALVTDEG